MRAALSLIALALAAPASAATVVPVDRFDAIALVGGGEVRIRHGAVQKVTLLSGNLQVSSVAIENDRSLVIRACRRSCRDYRLIVEIVTPQVDAVAITGGGNVVTETGFPAARHLAASITGGGTLDLDSVPAAHVAASIQGGGLIRTDAIANLAVSIHGGGNVTYLRNPRTTVAINGGGTVGKVGR